MPSGGRTFLAVDFVQHLQLQLLQMRDVAPVQQLQLAGNVRAALLALQNAYSANARVMSSIKQMYDTLIQAM